MRRWAHKGEEEDSEYKTVIKGVLFEFLKIKKYTVSRASLSRMQFDIQQFFDDYIIPEEVIDIPLLRSHDYEKWGKAVRHRKVRVNLEVSKQVFIIPTYSDYELETLYKR